MPDSTQAVDIPVVPASQEQAVAEGETATAVPAGAEIAVRDQVGPLYSS